MMEKVVCRKKTLSILQNLQKDDYENRSQQIIQRFMVSPIFQQATTIGVTVSRYPEVNTMPLIETIWHCKKRVAVPKCIPITREMDFRLITSLKDLEKGYHQLMEPIVNQTVFCSPQEIDVLIVPGVVFSKDGYRIGFGGGYYDRYLVKFSGQAISFAFEEQVVESIPVESHDLPIEQIFTPSFVINCKG